MRQEKIRNQKQALRRCLLQERGALDTDTHAHLSEQLCETLFSFVKTCGATRILCFYPIDKEPDLRAFFQKTGESGKTLFFPRCTQKELFFYKVEPKQFDRLIPGYFGIPEPGEDFEPYTKKDGDLCLVPCLAADLSGDRIGYGKGYYDRFLRSSPEIVSACVLFERFLRSDLVYSKHDTRVNFLVTERRILRAL